MVSNAKGGILVRITDHTAATIVTTNGPRHACTGVDIAAATTEVCLIVKALEGAILGAKKGTAARLAAGVAISAALFGALRAKNYRLWSAKGSCILLASIRHSRITNGARFRPARVHGTDSSRIAIWRRRGGRQASNVQQGEQPSVTQKNSPVAPEQYTQNGPHASGR